MMGIGHLAWRSLMHHRLRTGLLAAAVGLTALLPATVQFLVDEAQSALVSRADATPLVVGAPGSRYDLVLNTLYFQGRVPAPVSMAEVDAIQESGFGEAIPVLARHHAGGAPLVGVGHEYYRFRGLRPAEGVLPQWLGDCVLGANVAESRGLTPGDTLQSDQENLYDLVGGYPLRLRVTGVLAPHASPDDEAIFVSLPTAWVLEGIGHGHTAAEAQDENARLLERDDGTIVLNASVFEANAITEDNVASFHFHGEAEDFPLTGILVDPVSAKGATILKGRYRAAPNAQILIPRDVVDELVGFVFRLKRFFDANTLVVGLATVLFLALVLVLSVQVRRRELETLSLMGCPRGTTSRLVGLELIATVGAGLFVAALGAWTVVSVGGWSAF